MIPSILLTASFSKMFSRLLASIGLISYVREDSIISNLTISIQLCHISGDMLQDKYCATISILSIYNAECCAVIESHNFLLILYSLYMGFITHTDTVRCHGNGVQIIIYICTCKLHSIQHVIVRQLHCISVQIYTIYIYTYIYHQRKLQRVKTILGTSRSRMQQPIAACTRAQTVTRPCPCATCI